MRIDSFPLFWYRRSESLIPRLVRQIYISFYSFVFQKNVPLIIKLNRKGWTGSSNAKTQQMFIANKEQKDYTLLVAQMEVWPSSRVSQVRAVAVAYSQLIDTVEVDSHNQKTILIQTFLNYTTSTPSTHIAAKVPELKVSVRETAKKVMEMSLTALERQHSEMWNNLWSSGFGISHSKAPNALNGDSINATIYYLLSQRYTFPFDTDLMSFNDFGRTVSESKALLLSPDRCYTGHSTLHAPNLWSALNSLSEVNRITSLWLLTLEKQGCHHLISSGAQGVMQAMILSMASLQFTNNHLEFNTPPNELHRNYYIRRVIYGNETLLNITVALADNNKAQIFVALDKNGAGKQFFACDAGCLDAPVRYALVRHLIGVSCNITNALISV